MWEFVIGALSELQSATHRSTHLQATAYERPFTKDLQCYSKATWRVHRTGKKQRYWIGPSFFLDPPFPHYLTNKLNGGRSSFCSWSGCKVMIRRVFAMKRNMISRLNNTQLPDKVPWIHDCLLRSSPWSLSTSFNSSFPILSTVFFLSWVIIVIFSLAYSKIWN